MPRGKPRDKPNARSIGIYAYELIYACMPNRTNFCQTVGDRFPVKYVLFIFISNKSNLIPSLFPEMKSILFAHVIQ